MEPLEFQYFPLRDFGPLMKGLVIGGLGIPHVFLAPFAIGWAVRPTACGRAEPAA